jgi:hypothetical protein
VIPILHVSQLAKALGLPAPLPPPTALLAWGTVGRLHDWVERLRPLDWETLTRPTPSCGRSLRNLTVNVFHPFELLPGAWERGRFDWDPNGDDEREQALQSAEALIGYAERIERAWADFVARHEEVLERRDPVVDSSRGELTYAELLESQLAHAELPHAPAQGVPFDSPVLNSSRISAGPGCARCGPRGDRVRAAAPRAAAANDAERQPRRRHQRRQPKLDHVEIEVFWRSAGR